MDTINRSYFYTTVDGWGHRSFFTYFSEFQRSWAVSGTIEAAILSVIFVTSIVANTVIIYVVLKHHPLQTVANYFIINLAVADLTFTLSIPVVAIVRTSGTWILGDVICRLIFYFQCVCGAVLIWSLTLISVDRYRCIVVPPFRPKICPRHSLYIIAAMWSFFLTLFVPVAVWFQVVEFPFEHGTIQVCTLVFPYTQVFRVSFVFITAVLVFACMIPTILLVFNYHRIFRQLLDNQKKWQKNPLQQSMENVLETECPHTSTTIYLENIPKVDVPPHGSVTARPPQAPMSRLQINFNPPDVTRCNSIILSAGNTENPTNIGPVTVDLGSAKLSKVLAPHKSSKRSNTDGIKHKLSLRRESWKCYSEEMLSSDAFTTTNSTPDARSGRHYRAIKILVLNVVVVIIMWLPLMIMICAIYVDGSSSGAHKLHSHHFVYCLFIAFANTSVNPILYGVLNDNFRRCFMNAWQQHLIKHQRQPDGRPRTNTSPPLSSNQ